jgi:hypothetical protein
MLLEKNADIFFTSVSSKKTLRVYLMKAYYLYI